MLLIRANEAVEQIQVTVWFSLSMGVSVAVCCWSHFGVLKRRNEPNSTEELNFSDGSRSLGYPGAEGKQHQPRAEVQDIFCVCDSSVLI